MTDSETKLFLIDSNILVYAFDSSEDQKYTIARKFIGNLLDSPNIFALSTQNLGEFFHVVTSKIKYPLDKQNAKSTVKEFTEINNCKILTINSETILSACEISYQNSISFWDSLLISTMKENKIFNIYTENTKDFKIAGINAVNPFIK